MKTDTQALADEVQTGHEALLLTVEYMLLDKLYWLRSSPTSCQAGIQAQVQVDTFLLLRSSAWGRTKAFNLEPYS